MTEIAKYEYDLVTAAGYMHGLAARLQTEARTVFEYGNTLLRIARKDNPHRWRGKCWCNETHKTINETLVLNGLEPIEGGE